MTHLTHLLPLALLATPQLLHAQDRDSLTLSPVVVTATGHHQRLATSPVGLSVLSKNDLETQATPDLASTLSRALPQVSISPNSTGDYLHLGALGNRYTLVLLDGKPIVGDLSGNVNMARIDLTRVQRIEVVDGAQSTLYGSDAIAGVINIITRPRRQPPTGATLATRVSSHGQLRQSVQATLAAGRLSSITSYTHSRASYYQNNALTYGSKLTNEPMETLAPLSSGYRTNIVSQRLSYDLSPRLSLWGEALYSWNRTHRPDTSPTITGGFDYELRQETFRTDVGADWRYGGQNLLQARFTTDRYHYGLHYDLTTKAYAAGTYLRRKEQRLLEGELKTIVHPWATATTVAGLVWRNSFLKATTGNVDGHDPTAAAYLQHQERLLPWLTVLAGLRATRRGDHATTFTPRLSLLAHSGQLSLRAGYAMGYRSPGLDELYYRYATYSRGVSIITIGNPALSAEHSHYFSLSANYQGRGWHAGVTGFLNNIDNIIVRQAHPLDAATLATLRRELPDISDQQAAAATHYNVYQNADRGRVWGVQANGSVALPAQLTLSAAWAWMLGRQQTEDTWHWLERSIRNTLTAQLDWHHQWRGYRLMATLSGRLQSRTHYPAPYEDAPGHGLWNLQTRHRFSLGKWLIEPTVGIDNIFNTRDTRIGYTNRRYSNFSPGRMVVVGGKIRIEK